MHIGILGGTFDPIHNGHLHLAETVLETLALDNIMLIPCNQTVHREQPIASSKQRLKMTALACESLDDISCNAIEFDRGGKSYTIDTLRALKTKHPNDTLYFIIGYDAFLHFTQWNDWPEVLNLVNLVVAKRPETEPENKTTRDLLEKCEVKAELVKSFSGGKICVMEINALDISSTEIRKKLKNSLNVTRILPITVYNFIQHEGIYAK